jgi:general secretion pathway protein B
MSFILDALKKSESERQRKNGPALFEVKVAPPKSRFGIWAVGLGTLLLINLVVVGWLLVRHPARHGAVAAALPTIPAATAGAREPLAVQAPTAPPPRPLDSPNGGVAIQAPVAAATTASSERPSAAAGENGRREQVNAEPADTNNSAEDLAPAVEPARAVPRASEGVVRATTSGLPTYQDAAAEPGANLPELRLDLHDYSPRPEDRFVFLNMTKLREGDSLPQGVRVESITPDGVILSYRGTKFVLMHE